MNLLFAGEPAGAGFVGADCKVNAVNSCRFVVIAFVVSEMHARHFLEPGGFQPFRECSEVAQCKRALRAVFFSPADRGVTAFGAKRHNWNDRVYRCRLQWPALQLRQTHVCPLCSERWQLLKIAAGKQDVNKGLPVAVEPAGGGSGERVQQALAATQPGDLGIDVGADQREANGQLRTGC